MVKLVQKISSIVARTGNVFRRRKLSMSEAAARKYQKLIFEKRPTEASSDIRTPTYEKISEQLNSRSDQVFESAVYHLAKIAVSVKRYRNEITAILNDYAQNPTISAKRKEYLDKKIAEIK